VHFSLNARFGVNMQGLLPGQTNPPRYAANPVGRFILDAFQAYEEAVLFYIQSSSFLAKY